MKNQTREGVDSNIYERRVGENRFLQWEEGRLFIESLSNLYPNYGLIDSVEIRNGWYIIHGRHITTFLSDDETWKVLKRLRFIQSWYKDLWNYGKEIARQELGISYNIVSIFEWNGRIVAFSNKDMLILSRDLSERILMIIAWSEAA